MINNKKLDSVITGLFIRGRGLKILIAFIIMKVLNKKEIQQIALNYSSGVNFKVFIKIYKNCTSEPYSFLVNEIT